MDARDPPSAVAGFLGNGSAAGFLSNMAFRLETEFPPTNHKIFARLLTYPEIPLKQMYI